MFNNKQGTLESVPFAIRDFYHEETRREETGEYIDEPYFSIDDEGNPVETTVSVPVYQDVTYIIMNEPGEVQYNVEAVMNRGADEAVVKKFVEFENNGRDQDFHGKYLDWLAMEPDVLDDEAHNEWLDKEPQRLPTMSLNDYPQYPSWRKLLGVSYDGVQYSATKEDAWGLGSIESFIRDGNETIFEFANGVSLKLSASNFDEFMKVWRPFRQGFFD